MRTSQNINSPNTCPQNTGTEWRSNYLQEYEAENKLFSWKKQMAEFLLNVKPLRIQSGYIIDGREFLDFLWWRNGKSMHIMKQIEIQA